MPVLQFARKTAGTMGRRTDGGQNDGVPMASARIESADRVPRVDGGPALAAKPFCRVGWLNQASNAVSRSSAAWELRFARLPPHRACAAIGGAATARSDAGSGRRRRRASALRISTLLRAHERGNHQADFRGALRIVVLGGLRGDRLPPRAPATAAMRKVERGPWAPAAVTLATPRMRAIGDCD